MALLLTLAIHSVYNRPTINKGRVGRTKRFCRQGSPFGVGGLRLGSNVTRIIVFRPVVARVGMYTVGKPRKTVENISRTKTEFRVPISCSVTTVRDTWKV